MSEWQIGVVTAKAMNKGKISSYPIPGWVSGIWGLDFRTAWDVGAPVYCLTHLPSGLCVCAFSGPLAEVQAFVDALDEVADWNSAIGGELYQKDGRTRSPANADFDNAFHEVAARFRIEKVCADDALAPFTVDCVFMGRLQ